MNQTDHCNICENQKHNFQNGVYCALSNKKPYFQGKCVKIKFGDFLKEKTKKVNLDYELIKRTKKDTYFSFFIYLIISLVLIIGTIIFIFYALSKGAFTTYSIVPIAIGFGTLVKAISSLVNYHRDIKITINNKEKHNILLAKYGIKYTFDFKVKHFHDIEEITTDLKFPTLKI